MIARSEITDGIPNRRHFAKRKYPKKWTHKFIVCQSDCGHKAKDTIKSKELCRMLNTLFSNELGKKERLIKLENEFDISIDNDLKEEVEEMCNLGQGILERGEARGRQEGIREGRQEAREEMAIEMYKEGMSIKIIAKITKASENDIEQILINNGVK